MKTKGNMNTTNYTGIDYGLGRANIDSKTGIRYGVISQHTPDQDAVQNIWQNCRDLSFEAFQDEAKLKLRGVLDEYFSDWKHDDKPSNLDMAVQNAFESIEQELNDSYECDGSAEMLFERDGYKITTCLDSDLMILTSPYFTHAQFCSPCVPGAGNLDNYCADGAKTYCLGHDWFEDNKAPYPVYSVETGEQVAEGNQ